MEGTYSCLRASLKYRKDQCIAQVSHDLSSPQPKDTCSDRKTSVWTTHCCRHERLNIEFTSVYGGGKLSPFPENQPSCSCLTRSEKRTDGFLLHCYILFWMGWNTCSNYLKPKMYQDFINHEVIALGQVGQNTEAEWLSGLSDCETPLLTPVEMTHSLPMPVKTTQSRYIWVERWFQKPWVFL